MYISSRGRTLHTRRRHGTSISLFITLIILIMMQIVRRLCGGKRQVPSPEGVQIRLQNLNAGDHSLKAQHETSANCCRRSCLRLRRAFLSDGLKLILGRSNSNARSAWTSRFGSPVSPSLAFVSCSLKDRPEHCAKGLHVSRAVCYDTSSWKDCIHVQIDRMSPAQSNFPGRGCSDHFGIFVDQQIPYMKVSSSHWLHIPCRCSHVFLAHRHILVAKDILSANEKLPMHQGCYAHQCNGKGHI